jgi:anti-sigma regulatory factor (Ser/Thr protein kinase)
LCTFDRCWHLDSGDFDSACHARIAFRESLRPIGTPDSDFDGAEIIFGELVTNALRHSGSAAVARVRCEQQHLVLEVRDGGEGFDLERAAGPGHSDAEGGRGLMIAQKLAADLRVESNDGAFVVKARLPVACLKT